MLDYRLFLMMGILGINTSVLSLAKVLWWSYLIALAANAIIVTIKAMGIRADNAKAAIGNIITV